MKLDWMMLANHAESTGGLVNIIGGGWDTITVNEPIQSIPGGPPPPENLVAVLQGSLALRLLFHSTETNKKYTFTILVMTEDGGEIAKIEGELNVKRAEELPAGWDQGTVMVVPVTGLGINAFGRYSFNFLLNGQHLGEAPFRVVKGY